MQVRLKCRSVQGSASSTGRGSIKWWPTRVTNQELPICKEKLSRWTTSFNKWRRALTNPSSSNRSSHKTMKAPSLRKWVRSPLRYAVKASRSKSTGVSSAETKEALAISTAKSAAWRLTQYHQPPPKAPSAKGTKALDIQTRGRGLSKKNARQTNVQHCDRIMQT